MPNNIEKIESVFIEKFGCAKNLDEPVGKHSNYSYRSFLDFCCQTLTTQNQEIIDEILGVIPAERECFQLTKPRITDERYEKAREYETFKFGFNKARSEIISKIQSLKTKEEK